MQSSGKGDVELSVTLDTSGLKKDTEKIKKEIEQGVKSGNTNIKPQADLKPIKEVSDATKDASGEMQKLAEYTDFLSDRLKEVQDQLDSMNGTMQENTNLYSNLVAEAEKLKSTLEACNELRQSIGDVSDLSGMTQDTENIEQNAEDIDAEMERLQQILNRNRDAASALNGELANAEDDGIELVDPESLGYSEEAMEFVRQFGQEAENAQEQVSKLEEGTGEQFADDFARFVEYIQAAEEKAAEMAEVIEGLKDVGVDPEELAKMEKEYDALINKIALMRQSIKMGSTAWNEMTPNERFTQFTYKLKAGFQELGQTMQEKVVPALKKFAEHAAKAIKSSLKSGLRSMVSLFKKLTPQINATNKSLGTSIKQILKYALGIGSLVMLFNKLRAAVKEGVNNLAQWKDGNNEVNENLSNFISLLLQLKNQLAAAFAPILNTVVPILNQFIDSLIEAGNYLSQFLARLTGQDTWIKALKVQKNYADSLNKTGKAAKDASGSLAKFDDLDVLSKKDTSGGGSTVDPNDMFEEVPISEIEDTVEGWVEKLKIAWENADFTDIGGEIGQWLKNALDNIPWGEIKSMASKIAKSIATLLNGFFETEGLAESIGRTLANAFDVAFTFLDDFVHTLHWSSIGKFIGTSLVTFIKEFPWETAGQALGGALVGVITMAYNAVKTFTEQGGWESLVDGILSFIDNFLEEMNRKPKQKGHEGGMDGWEKLGQTIYLTIHNLLTSLTNLVKKLPIDEIMEGLTKVGKNAQVSQLVKDFFGLAEAIVQAITLALQHVANDEEAKKELGHAIGAILNGILDLGDDLAGLAGTILTVLADSLKTAAGDIQADHPLAVALATAIGAALIAVKTGMISPAAVANISTILSGALGVVTLTIGKVFIAGIAAAVIGFNVGKWLGDVLFPEDKAIRLEYRFGDVIKELFGDPKIVADAIGDWWNEEAWPFIEQKLTAFALLFVGAGPLIVEALIEGFKEGLDNVDELQNPIVYWFAKIIHWIEEVFKIGSPSKVMEEIGGYVVEGFIIGIEAMITKVQEIWTHIKDAIFEKVTLIKDSVMTKVDAFKLAFLGAFVTLQSKFVSIWNSIKDGVKNPINAIIGLFEGMVNKIIDGLNGLIEKANNFSKAFKFKNPFSGETTSLELNLDKLNHISIPKLAQGAVIPPNREFLAMLGDQRQGTNIEAPLDTITEAFADVVGSMRGAGNAVMTLDGQTFARLVVPYVMNELDRRGYNVKVLEG